VDSGIPRIRATSRALDYRRNRKERELLRDVLTFRRKIGEPSRAELSRAEPNRVEPRNRYAVFAVLYGQVRRVTLIERVPTG